MVNKLNIYGSIGYTFLSTTSSNLPQYILVLADMHSQLPYCNDFKRISLWFNSKFNTSNILLEEVPRSKDIKLQGLFEESDHTSELREMYLNNKNIINAVDIRPYLVPFSWEILKNDSQGSNLKLSEYLKLIDEFFNFENKKIKEEIGDLYSFDYIKNIKFIDKIFKFLNNKLLIFNSKSKSSECDIVKLLSGNKENKLNIHFSVIKYIYIKFKDKYKNQLDNTLLSILQNNKNILEEINYHLDNIMEFYTILKIFLLKKDKKNIIIHTGLVHSEKILDWLTHIYNYDINSSYGVNNINEIDKINSGCFILPKDINTKF